MSSPRAPGRRSPRGRCASGCDRGRAWARCSSRRPGRRRAGLCRRRSAPSRPPVGRVRDSRGSCPSAAPRPAPPSSSRCHSEILDVSKIAVQGRLYADGGVYALNFTAKFELTMPSSRSLTPVILPMEMTISELFTTAALFEENQENLDADMLFVLEKDVIDLEEAVSDNILLDLPLRVLTDEEKTSEILPTGSSWQVLSEADYARLQAEEIVSDKETPFSKLDGLFD